MGTGRGGPLKTIKAQNMRALTVFALLAVFSGTASALLPGPYAPSSVGNAITFGAGIASKASTSGHAFSFATNGTVLLNGPVSFSPSSGVNVSANMAGEISKQSAAAAIGRFATKVIAPIAFGYALYDLARELGFGAATNLTTGGVEFTKELEGIQCANGTCKEFFDQNPPTGIWHKSVTSATQSRIARINSTQTNYVYRLGSCTLSACVMIYNGTPGTAYFGADQQQIFTPPVREVPPWVDGQSMPVTNQEFVDAIATKSGWPSTSNLAKATQQAIEAGEVAPVVPKTVTGPATGSSTTTTTDDGQKITTKTTTPSYTYDGPKVTTTITTTTTAVDKATGLPVGPPIIETQTPVVPETAPEKEPTITCGLPDTPACKIDETGTPDPTTDDSYKTKIDKTKADQDALRDITGGTADKPILAGWGALFITPPLAACVAYTLPRDMGAIDPCPVVDGVRAVMAFLWAITALWSGMRMVREVI